MIKLGNPLHSLETILEVCEEGITGNRGLKAKLSVNRSNLIPFGQQYFEAANTGGLYATLKYDAPCYKNSFLVGMLTKNELVKLYEQYFVAKDKPARSIYDSLLNAAKEQCPFCGGIGNPRNLDHFLPKNHFPQFSLVPHNLVPSCRDCNMDGKGQAYSTRAHEQIIQPYADNDYFFQEQWVYANYHDDHDGEPGYFEYYVHAPEGWPENDKNRAMKHFSSFDLAKRYSTQAGKQLKTVLSQIGRQQKRGVPTGEIIEDLLTPGIEEAQFVNHWQCGMYQALIVALEQQII